MEAKKRDSPVSTWPGPRWPQPPGSCLSTGSRRPTGRCSPAPAWRPARRPAPKRPIRPFPAFTQKKTKTISNRRRKAREDGKSDLGHFELLLEGLGVLHGADAAVVLDPLGRVVGLARLRVDGDAAAVGLRLAGRSGLLARRRAAARLLEVLLLLVVGRPRRRVRVRFRYKHEEKPSRSSIP